MKTWVRKTLSVGVLAAGALLFGSGAAHADVRQMTGDNNGIVNGTQLVAPINVPVNVVGNAVGILGEANAFGAGVNQTEGGHSHQRTGNNNGILNGTQAYLPIDVPVNVVGNAVAVAGQANASGVGVNGAHARRGHHGESGHTTEGSWVNQQTGDNNGILNGTQLYAPINVPINVCGNALALLGGAHAGAICANGTHVHRHRESGHVGQRTGNNNGILNGTQLYAPINLPLNIAGNSLALLGSANSRGVAVNESGHGGGAGQRTGDNNGILNGTQIAAPISVPVNVCGNALGILGGAQAGAVCANGVDLKGRGGSHGGHGHGHHGHGGDNGGVNGDGDDYLGDDGAQGAGHDGYGDVQGADDDAYGAGRESADTEAGDVSPVGQVTGAVSGVSERTGLGGVLNALG